MKESKLIFIAFIMVELFLITILTDNVLHRRSIPLLTTEESNDDLSQNFYSCETPSSNTKLGYVLKPNCFTYFDGGRFRIPVTLIQINSAGFRDREYSIQKPNNTFRIIILGDSFTFGRGLNISTTYTKVLEKRLNSLNGSARYEVLNFGVFGYNTLQEVELFKVIGVGYTPDVVILQYFSNDIENLTRKDEIVDDVITEYKNKGFNISSDRRIFLEILIRAEKILANERDQKSFEDVWHIVETPLEELHNITLKNNIPVLIISLDLKNDEKQIPALKKICEKYNWSFISLADYGYESKLINEKGKIPKDGHFNEFGNEIVAGILYDKVITDNLIEKIEF